MKSSVSRCVGLSVVLTFGVGVAVHMSPGASDMLASSASVDQKLQAIRDAVKQRELVVRGGKGGELRLLAGTEKPFGDGS
jgi:hypothetical protein